MDRVEQKLLVNDEKFEQIFRALDGPGLQPTQGVFFDGEVFDAFTFVADLIRKADRSIALVDNYIDDSVLTLLSKRKSDVVITLYTRSVTK